jgi:NAD(P)-dependent dehydrogenase (short-subunit alcohol dehydrogenase family)
MTDELFSIDGKVALVTGGSRGIGEMIATGFVQAGARTYISSRKAQVCDAVAARLSEGGDCVSLPHDLSIEEGVAALAADIAAREERLDVLVNNAGANWGAPLEEYPDAAWDKVMAVNVKAVYNLTRLLLPQLRASASDDDPARVINIGSVDGMRVPTTENYAYAASKAAVHMVTRQLAHQLVTDRITVNAIAPGPFESKMMAFILDDPAGRRAVAESVPLGRIGRPEDVAGTARFLASRAGSYLTGAIIAVDGGLASLAQ